MNCQRIYTSKCPNPRTCDEECQSFKPFPPRMTNEEFAKKQSELLKDIPNELHEALAYTAWDLGHSAGYEEVINYLSDLVSNLIKPLKSYEERIRMNCIPTAE